MDTTATLADQIDKVVLQLVDPESGTPLVKVSERARERAPSQQAEVTDEDLVAQLSAALDAIKGLPGLEIELCGTWLWVSGNTRPVKDQLKAAGFWWSSQKGMWYWTAVHRRRRGGRWSMDQIRERYGSSRVTDDAA